MQTADLIGVDLDYWVAKALGLPLSSESRQDGFLRIGSGSDNDLQRPFCPSTDFAHGGPLLESNQIFIDPPHDMHVHGGSRAGWHSEKDWMCTVSARVRVYWRANDDREGLLKRGRVGRGKGPTLLIAAMRAIVTSVYGEQVSEA